MINVEVRSKLKEYCRSRKMSLRDLSELSGIDTATLYKRGNPTLKTIGILLVVLDCKFEDIFDVVVLK